MKYLVKMRNPVSGKLEAYTTKAENLDDLRWGLEFWRDEAGYEIVSWEELPS